MNSSISDLYMDDQRDGDDILGDEDAACNPKRKSPFVQMVQSVRTLLSPMEDDTENSPTSPKQARKHSFDSGLPALLPHEAELALDIIPAIEELDSGAIDGIGINRVERESEPVSVRGSSLKFRVVMFLSKGDSSTYDIGVYIRVIPPDTRWVCKNMSMMVMLVNASDPFSRSSKVSRDTCVFSHSDYCRGWVSLASFDSLETLKEDGFVFGSSTVICRGQASVLGGGVLTIGDSTTSAAPYRGLRNLGATCYLNGLLQSLFHIPKFREIVYSAKTEGTNDILSALQIVFHDLETSDTVVSLDPLIKAFGWDLGDVGIQHDAQELSRILIDRIEDQLKPTGQDKLVHELFSGELENYIQCLDVDFKSTRVERFYDLQLNIVTLDKSEHISSVEEALKKYLANEILDGQNLYDTEEKFGKQRAEKGVRFLSLPPVLTFQLMRFQFDIETYEMEKIHSSFAFPEELDMGPELGGVYCLHSVLVHSGNVNSGHYYAYIRPNAGSSGWYKFDDDEVTKTTDFSAIENNFGGPPPDNGCVNYLHGESRSSNDRIYSAYMLSYIRKSQLVEILEEPKKFNQLDESIRNCIISKKSESSSLSPRRRRRSYIAESIPVFQYTLADLFSCPVPDRWISGPPLVLSDPSARISELPFDGTNLLCFDPTEFRFIQPQSEETVGELAERIGWAYLVMTSVPEATSSFLIHLNASGDFTFHSIGSPAGLPTESILWTISTPGKLVRLHAIPESIPSGSIFVFADPTDDLSFLEDSLERKIHSRTIELVVYTPDGLLSCPEDERVVSRQFVQMDDRDEIGEIEKFVDTSSQLLVYSKSPFESLVGAKANVNLPNVTIGEIVTRDTSLHCVPVPSEIPTSERDTTSGLICLRFFSKNVVETACRVLRVLPTTTLAELTILVHEVFNIPPDHPLRLVEVDPVECEILDVFSADDVAPVTTLSCWGTRNVFLEYLRVEPDDPLETTRCYHYDRSGKKNFGHPFLVNLPKDVTERVNVVAEKLLLPVSTVKGWKLVETELHGETMLELAHNQPSGQHRDRPLLIKR